MLIIVHHIWNIALDLLTALSFLLRSIILEVSMNRISILCILSLGFIYSCIASTQAVLPEKRIVIVIASYNNLSWCKKNLLSVVTQHYNNYHILYVDDASCDGTGAAVELLIQAIGIQDKITLIRNQTRKGALENQYHAIHSCDDKDIILMLDGDDRLLDQEVLAYINKQYTDDEALWLTYGQYLEYPSLKPGICCPISDDIVRHNLFRKFRYVASHVRTFYAGLFKHIKKEDLCDDQGSFFTVTGDLAAMMPMLEMARGHFKFISKPLYEYNTTNPLNDYKVALQKQHSVEHIIRSRKPYERIINLW